MTKASIWTVSLAALALAGSTVVAQFGLPPAKQSTTGPKRQSPVRPASRQKSKARASAPATARDRALTAMSKPVSLEFLEVPLEEFAEQVQRMVGFPILLDRKALDDIGMSSDLPITVNLNGVSASTALDWVLSQHDLALAFRDETLQITSAEEAERHLAHHVFVVADLLGTDESDAGDTLVELIQSSIAMDSWANVGGPGSVVRVNDTLIVSQTESVLREVAVFLSALRRLRADSDVPISLYNDAKITAALAKPNQLDFTEVPLEEVVESLSDHLGIPFVIDSRSLEEQGIAPDAPVSLHVKGVSARAAMRLICRSVDPALTVTSFRGEMLVVSTHDNTMMSPKIYPVVSRGETLDDLIGAITETVAPDSWEEVGGPAAVIGSNLVRDALIIHHMDATHVAIEKLIAKLNAVARADIQKNGQPQAQLQLRGYFVDSSGKQLDEIVELVNRELGPAASERGAYITTAADRIVVRHRPKVHLQITRIFRDIGMQYQASDIAAANRAQAGGGMGGGGGFF